MNTKPFALPGKANNVTVLKEKLDSPARLCDDHLRGHFVERPPELGLREFGLRTVVFLDLRLLILNPTHERVQLGVHSEVGRWWRRWRRRWWKRVRQAGGRHRMVFFPLVVRRTQWGRSVRWWERRWRQQTP